jgi:hypothetical protein
MDGYCALQGALTECTVECTNNLDCPCNGGACASMFVCGGVAGMTGFCNLSATCTYSSTTHNCT